MRPILNKFAQPVGAQLESFQVCQLPFKVEKGQSVQLIPVDPEQIDPKMIQGLWQSIQQEPDARCWTYLPYPPILDEAELTAYFQNAFHFAGAFHYAIQVGEQFVGWVGLLNIRPTHAVIEIGNVYFSQAMKQSTAATETIYLLLRACFAAGYRRVEWKCDDLNAPSKKAALRFGFTYEGLFRQHVIVKGRNRDTAWYAMLDQEWSTLSLAYEAWLKADNFDQQGLQKVHLKDFIQLYSA